MDLSQPPVHLLPYDLLEKIFLLCLPENPLNQVQPNKEIAPLLLCHICFSWRNVALGIPALWSHLNYRLHIVWKNQTPFATDSERLAEDIRWLEWWRKNQGQESLIRFGYHRLKQSDYKQKNPSNNLKPLPSTAIRFLVEFISSATYLDIGFFTSYLEFLERDGRNEPCHLRSLVVSHSTTKPMGSNRKLHFPLSLFCVPQTLRHLCLFDVTVCSDFKEIFAGGEWSGLTHLSLHDISMNPQAWYSLIRLTPNLQWAYLDIFFLSHHDAYAHRPSDHTLPFLSTLTAFCNNFGEGFDAHEILFMNLHLPALHDLSLYIEVDSPLELARIHTRINGSLKGLPSVTKLTLGLQLYACRISELNTLWRQDTGIEKLVHCTPNVNHLVLEMWPDPSCRDIEQETLPMLHYWTNMLRPGRWLDLKNPGAISKVTVVVRKSWVTVLLPLAKDSFGKLLGLDKENENDECSVVLEVVEEGKWEFGPHSKQWESWGMSF